MEIGASSACFYPLETEKSLIKLAQNGINNVEIFFNAFSELRDPILGELKRIVNEYGIKVNSVHPFMAFDESYFVFTDYERRFKDSLELYKRFYDVANFFDAEIMIIHGERRPTHIKKNLYFERFGIIAEQGRRQGVILTQENAAKHRADDPLFLLEMKNELGDLFKLTFDIKQARRAGHDPYEYLLPLISDTVNLHISDSDAAHDCLPPGKGDFDFDAFFEFLSKNKYSGNCIVELYSSNFEKISDIKDAVELMKSKCKNIL